MRTIKLSEANKEVTVKDGKLFFDAIEVHDCDFIKEDSVAALYTIRYKENEQDKYWHLSCTMDLHRDQFWFSGCSMKFWVNQKQMSFPSCYFDHFRQLKYVLDNLCRDTAGKEWRIFEEEDFDAHREWLES